MSDLNRSRVIPTSDTVALEQRAERYFNRPGMSSPVFLSSERIAFLDDSSGVPQIAVLDLISGVLETHTAFTERVQSLLASPATGTILFGMDDGGNERQQLWAIDVKGEPRRLTTATTSIHEPGAVSRDGRFLYFRSNARDEGAFDVERLNISTGVREVLIENAGQPSALEVSPDGNRLLVTSLAGNLNADLLLMDITTRAIVNLTPHDGEAEIHAATFTTDGASILLSTNENREFSAIFRLDPASGKRDLIVEDDWDIEALSLSPDGLTLAVSVNDDGASRLWLIDAGDPALRIEIDAPWGTFDRFSWSPDSANVAFGISTPDSPSVVMMSDLVGVARTVAFVEESSPPVSIVPEVIRFQTFDDRDIPAFWYLPDGDGPWPTIVDIHGGPEAQRRLGYQPIVQFYVSLGFALLSTNVRGTTGYGKEYVHLDDIELRLDSVKDIAYGVAWLKSRDDVISDKIVVMGQSYGGFMTLASLCFYPDLWAAGFDIVGIANFVTFLERTGPWRRKHREAEYGSLEINQEFLEAISPINHIEKIVAPLFIIHGRNDPRVPLFEAEQVQAALVELERDVELRVFDNEGHGLSKRDNKVVGYAAAGAFLLNRLDLTEAMRKHK